MRTIPFLTVAKDEKGQRKEKKEESRRIEKVYYKHKG